MSSFLCQLLRNSKARYVGTPTALRVAAGQDSQGCYTAAVNLIWECSDLRACKRVSAGVRQHRSWIGSVELKRWSGDLGHWKLDTITPKTSPAGMPCRERESGAAKIMQVDESWLLNYRIFALALIANRPVSVHSRLFANTLRICFTLIVNRYGDLATPRI